MDRKVTLKSTNEVIEIPGIQRATQYGKTVVHIGWEDPTLFCLCGQDEIVDKISDPMSFSGISSLNHWKELSYEDAKEITCKKCLQSWEANRTRPGDKISARQYVIAKIAREHKTNGNPSNGCSTSEENEKATELKPEIEGINRLLKSGVILAALRFDNPGFPPMGHKVYTHMAAADQYGRPVAACNHNAFGKSISEYKPYTHITCPGCIDYIKTNELNVSLDAMRKRLEKYNAKAALIEELKRVLNRETEEFNAYARRVLLVK